MKKNKEKKQQPPKSFIKSEILVIILLSCATFIFVSTSFPNTTGLLGYWVVEFFAKNVFGKGILFLPVFLLLLSFTMLYNQSAIRSRISLVGIVLALISFSVFLEIYFNGPIKALNLPFANNGGGIIGICGLFALQKIIGLNGIWVFLASSMLISIILIFNLSIRNLVQSILYPPEKKKKTKQIEEKNVPFFNKPPRPELNIESDLDSGIVPSLNKPKPPIIHNTDHENQSTSFNTIKRNTNPNLDTYEFPSLDLLNKPENTIPTKNKEEEQQAQAILLEKTLESFNVECKVINVTPGPSVTRYELKPGNGVKIARITSLARDIALQLAASDIRIEAPIPGKALIGIEVPNLSIDQVCMSSIVELSKFFDHPSKLLTALGLTITGEPILMDLAKMPHILIAGATGSGKSVCINTIIISILLKATPDEVKFLMIDPKKVELTLYEDIPHLIAPVVKDPHKAAATLKKWALAEMDQRYEEFAKVGVKNIEGYNSLIEKTENATIGEKRKLLKKLDNFTNPELAEPEDNFVPKKLPYIVVIIDELADLMMVASNDVEHTICRLAQMARATGIHLVIATQRPSVNVITGLIKANVPSRISFFLQSQIDSRTILDMPGAEKLLGKGDMLYSPVGSFKPKRIQGIYVSESEIKNIVSFLKIRQQPNYLTEVSEIEPLESDEPMISNSKDALFEEAKEIVINTKYASASYLQRKLRIGYNRAARLMDELEEQGIISGYAGEKKSRVVLND